MGKSKKTILDIQKALLSNTEFIKEAEMPVAEVADSKVVYEEKHSDSFRIDPSLLKKIKILAAYEKLTPEEMVNSALNHFLRLKAGKLDEAMRNLTID